MIKALLDKDVRKFILENENADPFSLSIKNKDFKGIPIKELATQIAARKVAKNKLTNWFNTEAIIYPPKISMEQCSSELAAEYKASLVKGHSFIDLTGGAGVDSWAFSKKFDKGVYIEQSDKLCELTTHNLHMLGVDNLTFINTSAEDFVSKQNEKVDFIYIDPARRDKNKNKVFRFSDCEPNIEQMLPALLKLSARVMIKASPMLDIDLTLKSLSNIVEVHVVSINNECKEVLYIAENDLKRDVEFFTINLDSNYSQNFHFKLSELNEAGDSYEFPQKYLYEPNASIMKAGAFHIIGRQFEINKLHAHTHLYTSNEFVSAFPGRSFKIEKVIPYNKTLVRELIPEGKANITTRNFKEDVTKIRKKTKLRDGGDKYLFACTNKEDKPTIIICTKVNKPL